MLGGSQFYTKKKKKTIGPSFWERSFNNRLDLF
jgi:hypothetical protein